MAYFADRLEVRFFNKIIDGRQHRVIELLKPLSFYSDQFGGWITVPKGFVSDGASVPKIFWIICDPYGSYLKSAVIHDWLVVCGGDCELGYSSTEAAQIFLEAMKCQRINLIKRNFMFLMVLWFGPRF